ncbi:MAG: hypothetical protein RLZZ175_2415 [Bacteroidota bacterium]|jgi:type IX secretion system PorP/SprF family membrane protein
MKKIITIFALMSLGVASQAQQTYNFTQIFANKYIYSPAYAGQSENLKGFFHYRNQMVGFKGAPESMLFTLDKALPILRLGFGLQAYNDKINIIARNGAMMSLSYNLPLATDQALRFGLGVGFVTNGVDQGRIQATDPSEVTAFSNIRSVTSFNSDFGLTYSRKQLDVAFSASNLFNRSTVSDNRNIPFTQVPVYSLLVKHKFVVSQTVNFEPWAVARTAQGLPVTANLAALFRWKEILMAGLTYDINSNVGATMGLQYDDLYFGYNYGYPTNILNTLSGGIHEISVGFTFKSRKLKTPEASFAGPNSDSAGTYINQPRIKNNRNNDNNNYYNGGVQRVAADTTYHVIMFKEGEDIEALRKLFMGDHKLYVESKERQSITVDETKLDELERIESVKGLKDHADAFFTLFPNGKADIVIAAHKTVEQAKAYQKQIKRVSNLNTFLVKSKGGEFFYVVTNQVYSFKEANAEIKKIKKLGLENYIFGNIWLFGE